MHNVAAVPAKQNLVEPNKNGNSSQWAFIMPFYWGLKILQTIPFVGGSDKEIDSDKINNDKQCNLKLPDTAKAFTFFMESWMCKSHLLYNSWVL